MEENKQTPQKEPIPVTPEEELPAITELTMHPLPPEDSGISEDSGIPESSEIPAPEEPAEAAVAGTAEEETPAEEPVSAANSGEPDADAPIAETDSAQIPPEAPAAEDLSAVKFAPEEAVADIPAILEEPSVTELPETPAEDDELAKTIEDIEALLDKPVDQEFRTTDEEFNTYFQQPKAAEKKSPDHERPTRKGRPKRRRGEGFLGIPNILATFVWLALILAIGVTAGRMLWVCAADVLAFGREDKPVTITIYKSDTMEDIVDKLYDNGLIRYKSLFNLYASISDAQEDIKPGIYDLNTRYDYHALVNFMSPKSSREVVELTIPEGYTCQQIFTLLEENRVCTALDAASYAADGEFDDYWFLEGVPRGDANCLEGYLFPDTYEFYKNSTPREALQRMLNNFEIKFSEEMRAQIDTLNEKLTGDYTIREITIVASLIEKESAAPDESPKVAGVIYNRLFNWGDNPKLLGIDAAIVYAQGGNAETIDTSLDSPYNTYKVPGLVPGPIANPGLASLKAALNPETHEYFFYVLNPATGRHQFSTTQTEHNKWIKEFYG